MISETFIGEIGRPMMLMIYIVLIWAIHLSLANIIFDDETIRGAHLKVCGCDIIKKLRYSKLDAKHLTFVLATIMVSIDD